MLDALLAGMSENDRPSLNDPETYAIIGAAMEVHRVLGCGFLEAVYKAAMACELNARDVAFAAEVPLPVRYKGVTLPLNYRVDFLCYGAVLVEVKALSSLGPVEQAQAINYLRLAGLGRALLLNFGSTSLQHKRVVG